MVAQGVHVWQYGWTNKVCRQLNGDERRLQPEIVFHIKMHTVAGNRLRQMSDCLPSRVQTQILKRKRKTHC